MFIFNYWTFLFIWDFMYLFFLHVIFCVKHRKACLHDEWKSTTFPYNKHDRDSKCNICVNQYNMHFLFYLVQIVFLSRCLVLICFIYTFHCSEISKAQDRLTDLLQSLYKTSPQYREIVRMIMSTVGRGGEGDVGQRIRDEILVIQVPFLHHLSFANSSKQIGAKRSLWHRTWWS